MDGSGNWNPCNNPSCAADAHQCVDEHGQICFRVLHGSNYITLWPCDKASCKYLNGTGDCGFFVLEDGTFNKWTTNHPKCSEYKRKDSAPVEAMTFYKPPAPQYAAPALQFAGPASHFAVPAPYFGSAPQLAAFGPQLGSVPNYFQYGHQFAMSGPQVSAQPTRQQTFMHHDLSSRLPVSPSTYARDENVRGDIMSRHRRLEMGGGFPASHQVNVPTASSLPESMAAAGAASASSSQVPTNVAALIASAIASASPATELPGGAASAPINASAVPELAGGAVAAVINSSAAVAASASPALNHVAGAVAAPTNASASSAISGPAPINASSGPARGGAGGSPKNMPVNSIPSWGDVPVPPSITTARPGPLALSAAAPDYLPLPKEVQVLTMREFLNKMRLIYLQTCTWGDRCNPSLCSAAHTLIYDGRHAWIIDGDIIFKCNIDDCLGGWDCDKGHINDEGKVYPSCVCNDDACKRFHKESAPSEGAVSVAAPASGPSVMMYFPEYLAALGREQGRTIFYVPLFPGMASVVGGRTQFKMRDGPIVLKCIYETCVGSKCTGAHIHTDEEGREQLVPSCRWNWTCRFATCIKHHTPKPVGVALAASAAPVSGGAAQVASSVFSQAALLKEEGEE